MLQAAEVFVFLLGFYSQGVIGANVDVLNKEITVLPGQNATFMCRLAVPIQYCRVEIPGMNTLNLNRGSSNAEVSYIGDDLEKGDCGFTIHRVTESNNGQIKCTLGTKNEAAESVGKMQLIVAKAPSQPELHLSTGQDSLYVYRVGDELHASCEVRDGRPEANISWYLDDERIDYGQVNDAGSIYPNKDNSKTTRQNLTRILKVSDNGKYLRCVAQHMAYPNGYADTKRQLDIKFAPSPPEDTPIEKFGYEINQVGDINITIEANPKPHIEWSIGGQNIKEGSHDNSGTIEAEVPQELGKGRYLVNLRIARITKQDTERDYVLYAYNDIGNQQYTIRISTNAEPKGFELGIAPIIGIVVAILFIILVVSILIFAKVSGRWCFSGGQEDTRHIGESSDTESTDVRPKETKRRIPPIKLTSFFKRSMSESQEPKLDEEAAGEKPSPPEKHKELEQHKKSEQSEVAEDIDKEGGLVYAELDLVSPNLKPVVKNDDDKTEYAEIVYTPNTEAKTRES